MAVTIKWTNKEMDNLSLCNARFRDRKEALMFLHYRSLIESKKTPFPYKLTLTGSV